MRANGFNTYLLALAALLACVGCKTAESEKKRELSTFRVHLSMPAHAAAATPGQVVTVYRDNPVALKVDRTPFLTELQVTNAAVIDVMGGYAIQVGLDRRGTWLLEQYTVANKGRHLAIFSQFGETAEAARWLAAPLIQQSIRDGSLTFTPDASREEAERIVNGLLNQVRQRQRNEW